MITGIRRKILEALINKKSRYTLMRGVVVFCIFVVILVIALMMLRGYLDYHRSLHQGKRDTGRLTHTISTHVEQTFLAANQILERAGERQYFNSLFGNNLIEDIQNNLVLWTEETPQISAMLMANEHGEISAIYRKNGFKTWLNGAETIDTEVFFNIHSKAENQDMLYMGWAESSVEDNGGFIVLTRRISKLDGSFGGIMLAAVNSDYITHFFKSVELSRHSQLVVMREDGQFMLNDLTSEKEIKRLQHILDKQTMFEKRADHKVTILSQPKDSDEQWIHSFRYIPNLHIVVAVVADGKESLYRFWNDRFEDVITLILLISFMLIGCYFVLLVSRQMSRVQRSERAAVLASQAKSDFLANMSHELRTPLNAIIGFSEMMGAGYFGKLNQKQLERINDMHSCGTHLLSLINDILEFSKGEAGKIELRNEKVSLNKLADDVVRIMHEKASRDGVTLVSTMPSDLPLVIADERKIKQILLNLVSNSMKFTDMNGTIEIMASVGDNHEFRFSVTDTGHGMSEAEIPRALSAFGQVDDDPAKGGTGLGLPLCKMFAELHGGELGIQSIEGIGTKVTISLPAQRVVTSDAQATLKTLYPEMIPSSDAKKKR